MDFSKIVSIELFNFMVYNHEKLTFDERNIINLKGYNSAGKSTILRALAVCFLDSYKKRQTRFIRYGEDYFRIVVSFSDGVRIVRDKYINGQSLYEMYRGDELLFTTREGNTLTRVDDVPVVISAYLGLIVTELGCLNYQTRVNRLWLIDTTGSENYYSLNEVLKTEPIARANALLNSDKNKLGGEITEIEAELQSVELSLRGCEAISDELLGALMEKDAYVKDLIRRENAVEKILRVCTSLESLQPIPEVDTIEGTQLETILKLNSSVLELEKLREIPEVDSVDMENLKAILKVVSCIEDLEKVDSRVVGVEISWIDCDALTPLMNLQKTLLNLANAASEYNGVMSEYKKIRDELKKVADDAEKRGVRFVRCENCGSYMEVNTVAR